ncbi:MAG: hypothetical protein H6740_20920 [Alphaproteobacteria bacterium]|nr:hypothetical protein [Alphaproteobacteria bacterium]
MARKTLSPLLLALVACAGVEDPFAVQGSTPHRFEVEPRPDPGDPELAALQAAVNASLGLIRAMDPVQIAEGFSHYEQSFDETCPELILHNGQNVWLGDCTTQDGTDYYGNYVSFHWTDVPIDDAWYRRFLWDSGQTIIDAPDGTRFLAMGDAWVQDFDDGAGVPSLITWLRGDFFSDSALAQGSWMEGLYYAFLDVTAKTWPDGSRLVTLDGDVARLPTRVHAVTLLDITMRRGPGACSVEPEGTLRFEDGDSGVWYQMTFDGHDEAGLATAACDGCAPLETLDGEPAGTLCPDFSAWLEWEDWPW